MKIGLYIFIYIFIYILILIIEIQKRRKSDEGYCQEQWKKEDRGKPPTYSGGDTS